MFITVTPIPHTHNVTNHHTNRNLLVVAAVAADEPSSPVISNTFSCSKPPCSSDSWKVDVISFASCLGPTRTQSAGTSSLLPVPEASKGPTWVEEMDKARAQLPPTRAASIASGTNGGTADIYAATDS
jgi:hypothetical protein